MSSSRTLVTALVALALVGLHYTLRPILDWRAGVDFLIIAVLVVAARVRPGVAALTGFLVGLLADALTPEAFGAGALAMTLVGYTASQLKATFFADNVALNAVFVFAGKVAFDWILVLAERRLGGGALAAQLLLWTPLAALLTALVGLAVMGIVRPVLERRRP
ncbi:MAG: rod shape-determining protein MreD [Gemmatimonadaceae bacterium]|nr:rod shape-determining protein MreD [Gemmatimonadaceae bacterium]